MVCVCAFVLRLAVGGGVGVATSGGTRALLHGIGFPTNPDVWELRSVRALSASVVGCALAVSGVMLQSLLRNTLASPDIMGLASGSGFAVILSMLVFAGVESSGANAAAALAGALGAMAVIYLLSQRGGLIDPSSLVLVGVIISIICAAGTQLVRYMMPVQRVDVMRLILGALRDDVTTIELLGVGLVTLAATVIGVCVGRSMDAASLSDDEARSVGVRLGSLRALLFILSGALAAGSVVLAGPIGFVGLICPHVVRWMAGPSHRVLIVGSALAGMALMLFADSLVRLIELPSGRLPISVVTSIIGGPIFIWMLRRARRAAV